MPIKRGRGEQHPRCQRDSGGSEFAADTLRQDFGSASRIGIERASLRPAQRHIGCQDGRDRWKREDVSPLSKRRHPCTEYNEIGGVRDRQHEARSIGDEGADQKVRQRLDLCRPGSGIDCRRQHHRRCVVGKKHRHQRADGIDNQEQPFGGAFRLTHRPHRQPIEEAFLSRDLRKQHHADQKEIDVRALGGGSNGLLPG